MILITLLKYGELLYINFKLRISYERGKIIGTSTLGNTLPNINCNQLLN